MLDFIKKLFRKLIKFLKKYWWLVLIVVAFFLPQFATLLKSIWSFIGPKIKAIWTGLSAFAKEYGWKTTLAVGLGALSVLSPDTASRIVKNVADVAGDVISGGVSVAASGLSALLKNPVVLVGGGLALLYFTRRREAT